MLHAIRKNAAFTLIELLVVVIIVAVLASVGIPLMAGQVARARASEAEAGLGTIRTGLRAYFAENQTYVDADFPDIGIIKTPANNDGDLDGRFFSDESYKLASLDVTTYCIEADGAFSEAPRGDLVNGSGSALAIERSMNQDGTICQDLCPCSTVVPPAAP